MKWYSLIFSSLFIFVIDAEPFSRKLTTKYNPNCPPHLEENRHVAYTRAVSSINANDVMHFVTSAGTDLGPPSLLILRSSGRESQLSFNWTKMTAKEDGIVLEKGKVVFKAAYIITRLWEFNDTTDKGNMSAVPPMSKKNQSLWYQWDTDRFQWTVGDRKKIEESHMMELTSNQTLLHEDEAEMWVEEETDGNGTTGAPPTSSPKPPTPPPSPFMGSGKLQLRLVHSGDDKRAELQPRLQFTGNSTQLDVIMDHLYSHFAGSRFGITVVQMVSLSPDSATMSVKMTESVDDEFTPGIFKMYNWRAVPKKVDASNKHDRSFLQWKPVCYTTSDRHLKMSQQMYSYPLPNATDPADLSIMSRSIIFPMLKDHDNALPMNISFGMSQDGFYRKYNYTTWTASMGIGVPPADTISLLVIMIITIGLGLPVVLMICGFIYVCIRRRSSAAVTYERIN